MDTSYLYGPVALLFEVASYLVVALSIYKIATAAGNQYAWFAFIPLLQLVVIFQLGDMTPWWIAALIVPCLGWLAFWVAYMIAWKNIAENMGKPGVLGILAGFPVGNLIVPPVLAFAP